MTGWDNSFYIFIIGAVLVLSLLGLWFTAILPGMDRWSKRFFRSYFAVFLLCCLCAVAELAFYYYSVQGVAYFVLLFLECLLLSLPFPMLAVYLAHSCGENTRSCRLLRAAAVLMAVYFALLASIPFVEGFYVVNPDGWLDRGPLYPLVLAPMAAILLLTFEETLRRRKQLSRKVYLGLLFSLVPMTAALIAQMFVDVFQLLDVSYVISGLTMYSLVLSDQIERDLRRQREIARQQTEIANQRASIMVLQMRPHFIYNTMSSIYSLCNFDPQKARKVILDFTAYLRKNFTAVASAEPIPFASELEHTRAYLAVEQAVYEDSLFVEYDTPHTFFRVPPLTLQPIVENAVKHGRDPYAGPFRIFIRTRKTDSGSEITVADNGRGFSPPDDSEPHTALNNIRQRLEMMCGGSLTIGPNEGGGTVVTVTVPEVTPPPPKIQLDSSGFMAYNHIRNYEGAREMSTREATVSMLQAMPEEARLKVFEYTRRLFVSGKPVHPFAPLTEEQLLSDLEESRNQIAAGQGLDMKKGLEETGKKYGFI